MSKPGSESEAHRHALNLSAVAFSVPFVNKDDTIASLLKLPRPAIEKQTLLTVLALSGETIPSEVVLQGIEELLQQAKSNPWMLQEQEGWRLDAWLKLLPFTENVSSVLAVLRRLEERHKSPWSLRGLLSALSYSPFEGAENVLSELARMDQRFLKEHEWLAALTKRNTLNAARILLDLVSNASFPGEKGTLDDMNLGTDIAALMNTHAQFREEVYQRYASLSEGRAKAIIEYAVAEGADAQAVLLLVRDAAAHRKPFPATALYTALRHVLVGQRPSAGWSGMQELYSLPASDLRRELFGVVVESSAAESQLAAKCLTAIDQIRDDYGDVETERRHPDITRGIPWPQVPPNP